MSGKIRQGYADGSLIDYNSAKRVGTNFCYPDFPKITSLLSNVHNFPRISITSQDTSSIGSRLGLGSLDQHQLTQLSISVWAPPNLTVEISNTATESHTYNTGTSDYQLDNLPASVIGAGIDGTKSGAPHSFTRGTDYTLVDADYDGLFDSVRWSGGDTPDDSTSFTCGYSRRANGEELVRIIAQDVNKYIRRNWLTWAEADRVMYYFKIISSKPIKLDDFEQICRFETYCSFSGLNLGEEI